MLPKDDGIVPPPFSTLFASLFLNLFGIDLLLYFGRPLAQVIALLVPF